jgi:urease accessory protein
MTMPRLPAVALLLAATSAPAFAHVPIEGVGGFAGGLLHPILVPAHALSLAALGLFIGQQREHRVPLAVFAVALAAGLIAIAFAVGATPAENILLAGAMLTSVLVAAAWPPPQPIGWLLAAVTGAALGLDSPPQAITIAEGNAMLAGTAVGACLVVLAAAACGSFARRNWQKIGVRILGSWIAASAMLVLAAALTR